RGVYWRVRRDANRFGQMILRLTASCLLCLSAMALNAAAGTAMERRDSFPDVISHDAARFTALLNSAAAERRVEGIQGLSHLKHWPAEDALIHWLDDSSADVRREALLALCRIGTTRSVPRLIQVLDDPSWEIRN